MLRKVGSINNLIYRVTNDVDTLTASQQLRRLRDAGLLEQQGKGSATCYTIASALQPDQADEYENSNLESNIPDNSLSGVLEHSNLESNTPDNAQYREDLQLTLDLSLNIENDLTQIPEQLKTKVKTLGKRSKPEDIKDIIIELCHWKSLSSKELADILDRNQKYLLDNYLKSLIDEGRLQFSRPDNPQDPHQSYQAP